MSTEESIISKGQREVRGLNSNSFEGKGRGTVKLRRDIFITKLIMVRNFSLIGLNF